MSPIHPKVALLALLAGLLACSPLMPGAATELVTATSEPPPTYALDEIPALDELDIEDPPDWLTVILSNQPTAPDPSPLDAQVALNEEESISQTVGENGGQLQLEASDGVSYTLEIPPAALPAETIITMTHILSMNEATADGESLAAVQLTPTGLVLLQPAKLRIQLPEDDDRSGYLGFGGGTAGENLHAVMAVNVDGTLEISVTHFSMYGTVSGRHSNNARLLRAAISNSTPTGAARYYRQSIAQYYADWVDDRISLDLFTELITEAKREWYWRDGDGVYYTLVDGAVRTVDAATNRIEEPHLLERAIAHYLEWTQLEGSDMRSFFITVGQPYPFGLEAQLANRLITQGIKEGLEADCYRPIDALYKIRFYRLGLALTSNSALQDVRPFSATTFPEFTQDYALDKVKSCARFEVDFLTFLAYDLPQQRWVESGSVEKLSYVFGENPEVEIFQFKGPPENWDMDRVACHGEDGFIAIRDLRWPLNIFNDPDHEFQEQPFEVDLHVVEPPTIVCGSLPLPPFWVLHRALTCPLKFEMKVGGLIDRDMANILQQYECRFVDPEGNQGVFRDEIYLDHDPQISIFP